jgi:phosphopantetheinyl transferase
VEHSVLARNCFSIPAGRVDLWHARISDHCRDLSFLESLLSVEERERMARLVRAADRRGYAIGRGLLRCLLGRYLSRSPAAVNIVAAPSGKPETPGPITFNLSHSGDRLLIGVAREMPVGVDIQLIDPALPWRDFRTEVFSPEEEAALAVANEEAGRLAFFRCWALKEAITKMDGQGLVRPFGSFSAPSANDPHIRWGWLDAGPGFIAAWAARGLEASGEEALLHQLPHMAIDCVRPTSEVLATVNLSRAQVALEIAEG